MPLLKAIPPLMVALLLLESARPQTLAPSITQPTPVPQVVLKQDTPVQLKLAQALSNSTDTVGNKIELVLDQDLVVDGVTVARKGARALAKITEGKKDEGRQKGKSLKFELLYLKAGPVKVPLSGQMSGKGHRDAGVVVASTVFFGLTGLVAAMNSPKHFLIPEGTELTGYVAQDTPIPVPEQSPQPGSVRP